MVDGGIDEKWDLALKKRLIWVDGHKWSLEDAAKLVGVTRERMRQIQKRLDSVTYRPIATPRICHKVLGLQRVSGTIEEFWANLRSSGLSGVEEAWSKEALTELFLRVGDQSVVDALGRLFRELSPPPPSRKVNTIIRSHRAKLFGYIDLTQASESSGLAVSDVVLVLNELYAHVFHSGRIALAVQNPPALFVDSVARQLLVRTDLGAETLHEGVLRQKAYRGVSQPLNLSDFSELLEVVFGAPPAIANLPEVFRQSVELNTVEKAFLQKFRESGRSTLHRDELVSEAVSHGLSASSAGVYLSTSPIIRPASVRRGYFRLV